MNNDDIQALPPHVGQGHQPEEGAHCDLDAAGGRCISCSDEALPATILQISQSTGLALVEIQELTEEVDISLVDDVVPGDIVLVHGGVAISLLVSAGEDIDISEREA